ncbi:MAG TPA: cyclic nucleotide-binding domain-containing protein [Actinomycetes bacterium]|nr:cyclic nucleotide-binding domain-containing protein [Actinomycetes bacterium]
MAPLLCTSGLRALETATTPRPEDVELLGRVGVLAPLPRLTLERLACAADRREVATGVPVVREHTTGEEFFVVESGAMVVRREAVDVRRLVPGDAFGEVALLRSVPRTATVLTTAPGVLLSLSREVFVATVTGHRPTDAGADGTVSELLAADARRGSPDRPPARRPPRPGG